jgi:UDP-GlcNAc:undecaprenyl-phosphate GlcNAc-1-phosphate transferase
VSAAIAIAALPVAYFVLRALLRSPAGRHLVAVPSGERWHESPTPTFGGVGIFAGFAAGAALALAIGAVHAHGELWGIAGGCALLFAAGLADDIRHLSPLAKLAAQFAAAGIVLASGLRVEVIGNGVLATTVALLWLVGITNAFNLLDNMDGLAASLAAIACAYFAVDAATEHPNRGVLVLSLALGAACLGFLPLNLRPGGNAAVFMGDSGSQLLGFALAAFALSSSWKVAGTTLATMLLPLLVLAIPILDTTLVTVVRLLERRPVSKGGKDHTSHRLVYYGLSQTQAVLLLSLLGLALGATGIAYNVLGNPRVTVVGVLVTVVLLVQFASFLTDLEERARRGAGESVPSVLRALWQPRRLVEVLVDFALMCVSFLVSYTLLMDGLGSAAERGVFLQALPIVLAGRYVSFVAAGLYRRIWRFASVHDLVAIAAACGVSGLFALGLVPLLWPLDGFDWKTFPLDAVLCAVLVASSRLALRLLPHAAALRSGDVRSRVLVVGAGRFGRSLARELREDAAVRVVGFLDDNPAVRRRRVQGIVVLGSLDEIATALETARPDEVLVTIPNAEPDRVTHVAQACAAAAVPCRLVHRRTETTTALAEAGVELSRAE